MRTLWRNQLIFWNLLALILVKAVFPYAGPQFASLTNNIAAFTKGEVILQTNNLRLASGLSTLKENSALDLAASQKLQDMIGGQYFAHTSPSGTSPWHWIEVNKYNFSYAGENLAIGFWSAEDTVKAWANSPSHRENLLNSNFKEIGVAVAPAKIQNTSGFLVVQLFGTPMVTATKPVARAPVPVSNQTQVQTLAKQNAQTGLQSLQPTIVNAATFSGQLDKVAKFANSAFALYALIVFLASLLLLVFIGISRTSLVRTGLSFALIFLALIIPVIHVTYQALIL